MLYSNKTIAVPPGATIKEQLEYRKMTQKEFACRLGMSEKHVSNIINGKAELTQDVSLRLESIFGIPAHFWNNLESIYREDIARAEAENNMDIDCQLVNKMPYAQIADLGWVPKTKAVKEKVQHMRSFFEVAQLSLLSKLTIPGIAYRMVGEADNYALAIWAQKAKLESRHIEVNTIDTSKLKSYIPHIRALTTKNPQEFSPELTNLLSQCGIALVFLPHLQGSFLHGASFCNNNHIVMGLTVRGKDADKFWFSLFHELYHILNGDIFSDEALSEEQEAAADMFARDTLIPPEQYIRLLKKPLSKEVILSFSQWSGIAPGIVVGRLQKERLIKYSCYNDLKEKYTIR